MTVMEILRQRGAHEDRHKKRGRMINSKKDGRFTKYKISGDY